MGFWICRHITMKFCRKSPWNSHWRIHRRTITLATDRRMNPSSQVRVSFIFKIRASMMFPMTDRRICDGLSRGLVALLTNNPTWPGLGILKVFNLLNSPPLHLKRLFPSLSHFLHFQLPSLLILFSINWSTSLFQIPKSPFYWSEFAAVFLLLINECLTCLFFSSSLVCVSVFYPFP